MSTNRALVANRARKNSGAWPVRSRIWQDVAEYYVQIFSGVPARPVTEGHFEAALTAVRSFDAVLVLEELRSAEGHANAERLLRSVAPLPNDGCLPNLPKHKVNKGETRTTSAPLSAEERALVTALNPMDLRLYAHAVEFHRAQVRALTDPNAVRCETKNHPLLCGIRGFPANESILSGDSIMRGCSRRGHLSSTCTHFEKRTRDHTAAHQAKQTTAHFASPPQTAANKPPDPENAPYRAATAKRPRHKSSWSKKLWQSFSKASRA